MIIGHIEEAVVSGARRSKACEGIGLSARTVQRWKQDPDGGEDQRKGPKSAPHNRLSDKEREQVLQVVNSPEYRNLSPNQIVPSLADEGIYLASESTIYRILRAESLNTHRAASKPPKKHKKPKEHVADAPDQVWSWDITYLRGPIKGTFFYLYLIVDVFSRKIVGYRVFEEESSEYAGLLVDAACQREGIMKDTLVLHQDNGSPMKGVTLKATLEKLGVTASYSRPHVSDDNPFSESLFRTMKYRPEYPTKPFESMETAMRWVDAFVTWYNCDHKHSGIRYVTPEERHNGDDMEILSHRSDVYEAARKRHPERWSGKTRNWEPIRTVYLNPEDPRNMVSTCDAVLQKEAS
jgi:transposase InsO family protein